MSILNIMWAGGSAFASVQKVHQQILSHVDSDVPVHTWLLQGSAVGSDGLVERAVEAGRARGFRLAIAVVEPSGELVAFGRPFIANPDLVERLKAGGCEGLRGCDDVGGGRPLRVAR